MNGSESWIGYFPPRIRTALAAFGKKEKICEVRLRDGAPLSLTLFSGNVTITEKGIPCRVGKGVAATQNEMRAALASFCEGSVYRYAETMRDGFLMSGDGIRIGISFDRGDFFPESGSIAAMNIRIPRFVPGAAREIVRFFNSQGLCSLLIVSLPGAGKTTLIRDLALSLAQGKVGEPRRIAVIDERRELFPRGAGECGGLCDLLSGKPKAAAIETATRVLSPEAVICDEIGSFDDTRAMLSAQAGGSVFIATAHAASRETVMQKPHLKTLVEAGLFSALAVLEREPGETYASRVSFTRLP